MYVHATKAGTRERQINELKDTVLASFFFSFFLLAFCPLDLFSSSSPYPLPLSLSLVSFPRTLPCAATVHNGCASACVCCARGCSRRAAVHKSQRPHHRSKLYRRALGQQRRRLLQPVQRKRPVRYTGHVRADSRSEESVATGRVWECGRTRENKEPFVGCQFGVWVSQD